MTDKKMNRQAMDKEVQHSKTQAEALSLRGVGQRTLHQSKDRLSVEQAALFARMRDQGARICVTGSPHLPTDDPAVLDTFLSARLARGREVKRLPDFLKMPPVSRTTAVRSLTGGLVERVLGHPDDTHHFYGLSERGLALLSRHERAKRRSILAPTAT